MHKTDNKCPAMAIEQCHEQTNAIIKVFVNPPALRMVSSREVAMMIAKCELDTTRSHQRESEHHHNEQHPGVQEAFVNDVRWLSSMIEEISSSLLEVSEALLALGTRYTIKVTSWETVGNVEALSEDQYFRFVKEGLFQSEKPNDCIKTSYHCSVAHL